MLELWKSLNDCHTLQMTPNKITIRTALIPVLIVNKRSFITLLQVVSNITFCAFSSCYNLLCIFYIQLEMPFYYRTC